MPSRKVSKTVKPSQTVPQFGTLDTTPTSRQFQVPDSKRNLPTSVPSVATNPLNLQEDPTGSSDEFEDGIDDVDLVQLPDLPILPAQSSAIIWSDVGPETRENSPDLIAQTPRSLWNFEEGDAPTPLSDAISKDLPETNQFSFDLQPGSHLESQKEIDFSETASTGGRSSPVTYTETRELEDECAPELTTITHIDPKIISKTQHIPAQSPNQHLPTDEIYDATPAKSLMKKEIAGDHRVGLANMAKEHIPRSNNQVANPSRASKKRSLREMIQQDLESEGEDDPRSRGSAPRRNVKPVSQVATERVKPNTKASESTPLKEQRSNQKAKRSRQRAKSPLKFDEGTREFRDTAQADKPRSSPRMPIVSALREGAQQSSSPATSAKKTSAVKAKQQFEMQREAASLMKQAKKPRKPYTRAAAKKGSAETSRESNLGLKHNTRQSRRAAARTIESTSPLIVEVPSDPPSSSESDFCLSSLNHPETADTAINHPVREAKKTISRANRPVPEEALNLAHQPKRLPTVRAFDEEDSYIPYNEPYEPTQRSAQKRKKSPKPEDSGKSKKQKNSHNARDDTTRRQILGARDPNVQAHEVPQHKKGARQELQDEPSKTCNVPTEPVARCKVVRHYSISVAGSPVPMNNDSGGIADQPRINGSSSSGLGDKTISRKLNYDLLNSRIEIIHPPPGQGDGLRTTRNEPPSHPTPGNTADSKTIKPIPAPTQDVRRQRSPPHHFLPGSANTNKDMQRQIVAAFELQDANLAQLGPVDQEIPQGNNDIVSQRSPREIRDDVSVQLHSIVDIMTKHLRYKEETAYKAADAYQESVLKCIKKCAVGFGRDKQYLEAEYKKDCARFMKQLDVATNSVQRGQEKRLILKNQTADGLIMRHQLYGKATKTLRAIHQQLLGRRETDQT